MGKHSTSFTGTDVQEEPIENATTTDADREVRWFRRNGGDVKAMANRSRPIGSST